MKLFNDLLRSRGCEVLQAGTANDGMRLAYNSLPDLILTDIRLPDGSGLEVTRRLKQDQRTEAIPIVVLTASLTGEDQAKILESGCDAFLAKPIVVRDFLRIVDDILARTAG